MYDKEGKEVWHRELTIYGEVKELRGWRVACPFMYPGQYEDLETGLVYNRFRYYDNNIGQYISQDPIGLWGGIVLYAYVPDTNIWIDIFGLIKVYRLLRSDEDPTKGFNVKNPGRGMKVHGHVSSGSRNKGSQFISTSTDPKALEKWRGPGQRMVSFDTDDVVPDSKGNKQIIDISTVDKAKNMGLESLLQEWLQLQKRY